MDVGRGRRANACGLNLSCHFFDMAGTIRMPELPFVVRPVSNGLLLPSPSLALMF